MAKGTRSSNKFASRQCRTTPYPLPLYGHKGLGKDTCKKQMFNCKQDWEDAVCSVCLEFPHNAVLLLCSSHDNGCRPYMCATSYRYSNCLSQFMKAYNKTVPPFQAENGLFHLASDDLSNDTVALWPRENSEVSSLTCPLCRGQVKGWTVVESAREYLNAKKRSCMQDDCLFIGTYKELRKHMKAVHPLARPRKVDPAHEQKWKVLEWERERQDVISTVTASTPGAMILGDYVIEGGPHYGFGLDDEDGGTGVDRRWLNVLYVLQAFGPSGNAGFSSRLRRVERSYHAMRGETGRGILTSESDDEASGALVRLGRLGRPEHRRRQRRRRRSGMDVI